MKHLASSSSSLRPIRVSRSRTALFLFSALAILWALVACQPESDGQDLTSGERQLIELLLATEDARGSDPAALAIFRRGLASDQARIREIAVRGLGRLEKADLSGDIAAVLREDGAAEVRAEAANALAQAVFGADQSAGRIVAQSLLAALDREDEPGVRGAIAQSLGRLPLPTESLGGVEAALLQVAQSSTTPAMLGAVRGFESFTRRHPGLALDVASRDHLADLVLGSVSPSSQASDLTASRIRRLALATLVHSSQVSTEILERAIEDHDWQVRRWAVVGLARAHGKSEELASSLLRLTVETTMQDDIAAVRHQALTSLAPLLAATEACSMAVSAMSDRNARVGLAAIDLVGQRCSGDESSKPVVDLLTSTVASLPETEEARWHRPAHALVALAALAPTKAAELLPKLAQHPVWQVRMYAVRAAVLLGDSARLASLASDPAPNVAEAALAALFDLEEDELQAVRLDDLALAALQRDEPQVLLAAARGVQGRRHPRLLDTLIAAIERVTGLGGETSRDIRAELLSRIREIGERSDDPDLESDEIERLLPLLGDFDPEIARQAAETLSVWLREPVSAKPELVPPPPPPSYDELLELASTRVFLDLDVAPESGSPSVTEGMSENAAEVELRLRPFDAPTNTARFVRLAEQGYFNGLTFHRVVTNFVVQGGSPSANEYAGARAFSRDELTARSHWRGTVGVSTRGRDTGDAQIFINLVDNPRLDHNYTIFAEVVAGMETIDRVLEGAVIENVRLVVE